MLNDIAMTLYMHDLMQTGCVENSQHDEYESEAEQILHNIEAGEVKSVDDMKACVIFVFEHYFEDLFKAEYVTDDLVAQLFEFVK